MRRLHHQLTSCALAVRASVWSCAASTSSVASPTAVARTSMAASSASTAAAPDFARVSDEVRLWKDMLLPPSGAPLPSVSPHDSSTTAAPAISGAQVGEPPFTLTVAPNDTSFCVVCMHRIPTGMLRVGVATECPFADMEQLVRWCHVTCFHNAVHHPAVRGVDAATGAPVPHATSSYRGVMHLPMDALMVAVRRLIDPSVAAPPPDVAAQVERLQAALHAHSAMSHAEIRTCFLEKDPRVVPSDSPRWNWQKRRREANLVLADSAAFGDIDPCNSCGGILTPLHFPEYRCTGSLDANTACTMRTLHPTRTNATVPPPTMWHVEAPVRAPDATFSTRFLQGLRFAVIGAHGTSRTGQKKITIKKGGGVSERALKANDESSSISNSDPLIKMIHAAGGVTISTEELLQTHAKARQGRRNADVTRSQQRQFHDDAAAGTAYPWTTFAVAPSNGPLAGKADLEARALAARLGIATVRPAFIEQSERLGHRVPVVGAATAGLFAHNAPLLPDWLKRRVARNEALSRGEGTVGVIKTTLKRGAVADGEAGTVSASSGADAEQGARVMEKEMRLSDGSIFIPAAVDHGVGDVDRFTVAVGINGSGRSYSWHAALNVADVASGRNTFYILQILREDATGAYFLFRRWGRIGNARRGDSRLDAKADLNQAVTDFCQSFHHQTGNHFISCVGDPEAFVPRAKRLQWNAAATMGPSAALTDADGIAALIPAEAPGTEGIAEVTNTPLPLDATTRELIEALYGAQNIQAAVAELELDTTKLPLGQLADAATIAKARDILFEIEKRLLAIVPAVTAPDLGDTTQAASASAAPRAAELGAAERMDLLRLTNRYYTAVPRVVPPGSALQAITTPELFEAEVQRLAELEDLAFTHQLVLRAARSAAQAAPTESRGPGSAAAEDQAARVYRALGATISEVGADEPERQQIIDWFHTTVAPIHTGRAAPVSVRAVLRVDRHRERDAFRPWTQEPGRALLWHGSRWPNWGRVLAQGLRATPHGSVVTGYMFGRGIYFSDVSSKSLGYSFPRNGPGSGASTSVMAVAEVALGRRFELRGAQFFKQPPRGYTSVFGVGAAGPNPDEKRTCGASGADIFDAPVRPSTHQRVRDNTGDVQLKHNEYVVYDPSRVRLRYLLWLDRDTSQLPPQEA